MNQRGLSIRRAHLERLYALFADLERRVGGRRRLRDANKALGWPERGVYFVFEQGELREDSKAHRVVRVGTHALKPGAKSTVWGRLRQHRGTSRGGKLSGNHRKSVFRLHVGGALLERGEVVGPSSWGVRKADRSVRGDEKPVEAAVSEAIGAMEVLCLKVAESPSLRAWVESNCIALLSNRGRLPIDPPSSDWLGHHARAKAIRTSGLWNANHVDEPYDPGFLEELERLVYALPSTR